MSGIKINLMVAVIMGVSLISINPAMALRCYICTANTGGSDCERNVATVTVTNCEKRYCTMRRIEYKESNQVNSFYRSCEDNPMYMDKVIEDDMYRTFFRACAVQLCNDGTGKESYDPDGSGSKQLPPGVMKPLFDDCVLHPFSSSSSKLVINHLFVFLLSFGLCINVFL